MLPLFLQRLINNLVKDMAAKVKAEVMEDVNAALADLKAAVAAEKAQVATAIAGLWGQINELKAKAEANIDTSDVVARIRAEIAGIQSIVAPGDAISDSEASASPVEPPTPDAEGSEGSEETD
jgi:hypothetical protein